MSGRPALSSDSSLPTLSGLPPLPRLLVQDTATEEVFDVFEVVAASSDIMQVRSALLFEVGEELRVRIEHDGRIASAIARVRAHLGPDDARVTELEISDRTDPRTAAGR
jgi:hypothetical protein